MNQLKKMYNKPHIIAWVILLSIAVFSCNPAKQLAKKIEKAKILAYQNPKSFAEFCKIIYPSIDSLGKPVIRYIPANNTNYTSTIDSLTWALNILKEQVNQDTSVKGKYYRGKINDLSKSLINLKNSYKPCRPDTLGITTEIYKKSTSQIQSYINEIDLLKGMNSDLTGQLKAATTLKEDAKSNSSKKTWWIVSLGILLLGSGYLNVRKLFF